jgi:hypothetical protein
MNECTFAMLAGPGDATFVARTLRHLLKMCSFEFRRVVMVVDDLPKEGRVPAALRALQDAVDPLVVAPLGN